MSSARRVAASAKKDLHPELVSAKVICNGEEVAELTGTQAEYHVEVWSGNHPFYKGDGSALVVDEGQVSHTSELVLRRLLAKEAVQSIWIFI